MLIRFVHVAESNLSLTLIARYHLIVRLWGRKYIAATHFQLAEPRDTQNSSKIVGPRGELSSVENRIPLPFCVTLS